MFEGGASCEFNKYCSNDNWNVQYPNCTDYQYWNTELQQCINIYGWCAPNNNMALYEKCS